MFKSLFIFLICWIPFSAQGQEICLGNSLVIRSGLETCWVQLPFRSQTLCLNRSQWQEWLAAPEVKACGWAKIKVRRRLRHWMKEDRPLQQGRIEEFCRWSCQKTDFHLLFSAIKIIERVREASSEALAPSDPSGVWRKLLLNENVQGSEIGVFRLLGYVHLVSPTGIHLYAMARWLEWLLLKLCLLTGLSVRRARQVSLALSLATWGFAWFLTAAKAGMLRPWLVIVLRRWALWRGYRWTLFSPLLIALLLDLTVAWVYHVLDLPGAWAAGRVHYALAVGGGLMSMELMNHSHFKNFVQKKSFFSVLSEHFSLSVGSWLTTALWDALTAGFVAPWTAPLSLISIPFCALFLYPLLLLGAGFGAAPIIQIAAELGTALLRITTELLLDWDAFYLVDPLWIPPSLALALLFMRFRYRYFLPALILLAMGVRLYPSHLLEKQSQSAQEVWQWDVGQGDSALILSHHQVGMIDTGSAQQTSLSRWMEKLAGRGIRQVDWLFLSHLDEDHSGALWFLSELLPIACVFSSPSEMKSKVGLELKNLARQRGLFLDRHGRCIPYHWEQIHRPQQKGNAHMMAMLVPLSGGGFYLNLGDAAVQQEREFLKRFLPILPEGHPRILKVSHHGSRSSSSLHFLKQVAPDEAWISSGQGNLFSHPNVEVLHRLAKERIPVRRTDLEGDLSKIVGRAQRH